MKRTTLALLPCLLAVILAGLFVYPTFAHGAAASPTSCGKGWSVVSSPNRGNYNNNALSGVAAISANDVWAVGQSAEIGVHDSFRGLTEHWNGTAWSIVADAGPPSTSLVSVAGVATNDVWAVGSYYDSTQQATYSVIEHWNGNAWSVVTNPALANSDLSAVAAISSTDVWTVGDAVQGNAYVTLTMHWNGTAWSLVPSPSVSSASSYLLGVTTISTSDVWAVGQSSKKVKIQSFFEHWDGTQWTIVASPTKIINRPPPQVIDYQLVSIAAASSQMVWSVGVVNNYIQNTQKVLVERWDGTQWTIDSSVNMNGSLNAVSVQSPNDAWAVGEGQNNTLIIHWNGTTWNVVPSPNPGPLATVFNAVTGVPRTTQAWTVGYVDGRKNANDKTLTVFYC